MSLGAHVDGLTDERVVVDAPTKTLSHVVTTYASKSAQDTCAFTLLDSSSAR